MISQKGSPKTVKPGVKVKSAGPPSTSKWVVNSPATSGFRTSEPDPMVFDRLPVVIGDKILRFYTELISF